MTGRTLCTEALQELGVIGAGQTPSPEAFALALSWLKRLVNAQGADKLIMFELLRTTRTLTSGTRDYTIGTGGSINIVRPNWIDHASFVRDTTLATTIEEEIAVFTRQQWEGLAMKTLQAATVEAIFYDRALTSFASQTGTISTYPTINVANTQIVLYTPKAPAYFVDLDTEYGIPPGYQDAYHYELAYRLQRPFGRPQDPELKEQKIEAWRLAVTANVDIPEMVSDAIGLFGGQGAFDIRVGP